MLETVVAIVGLTALLVVVVVVFECVASGASSSESEEKLSSDSMASWMLGIASRFTGLD